VRASKRTSDHLQKRDGLGERDVNGPVQMLTSTFGGGYGNNVLIDTKSTQNRKAQGWLKKRGKKESHRGGGKGETQGQDSYPKGLGSPLASRWEQSSTIERIGIAGGGRALLQSSPQKNPQKGRLQTGGKVTLWSLFSRPGKENQILKRKPERHDLLHKWRSGGLFLCSI